MPTHNYHVDSRVHLHPHSSYVLSCCLTLTLVYALWCGYGSYICNILADCSDECDASCALLHAYLPRVFTHALMHQYVTVSSRLIRHPHLEHIGGHRGWQVGLLTPVQIVAFQLWTGRGSDWSFNASPFLVSRRIHSSRYLAFQLYQWRLGHARACMIFKSHNCSEVAIVDNIWLG